MFAALNAIAANAREATDRVEELAHFFPDRLDVAEVIAQHGRESERLAGALRITATFVTPIEREDLEGVAAQVDGLAQSTARFATLLLTYRVDGVRSQARRVTQLLSACAGELVDAVGLLRTAGDVAPHTGEIRALVDDGCDQVLAGLAELFAEPPDAVELVRWKDLFERLQAGLAAARAAAATLDVISSKQR